MIETYRPEPARYLPADPDAAEAAAAVAAAIVAEDRALLVEHVGSTAVPDLAGKGILDLAVIYPEGGLGRARDALARLGFQPQVSRDPFPETRPMRVGAVAWEGKRFNLHVHVIAASATEAGELIAFRDQLRADPDFRRRYEARKREILVDGTRDSLDYAYAKAPFFTELGLRGAAGDGF